MLPPVMPAIDSISFGVMTCIPTIALRMFGAYCSMVAMTFSPNCARLSSSQPPSTSYGAYCTKQDITCCPGGAISGCRGGQQPALRADRQLDDIGGAREWVRRQATVRRQHD